MELVKTYHSLGNVMCNKIISIFENSEDKKDGRMLRGLDKSFKNTTDLHSTQLKNNLEWNNIEAILHKEINCKLQHYYYDINNGYTENCMYAPFTKNVDSGYNIQKYIKGEGFYKFHHDSTITDGSYRILTYLWYLNDVTEGGETEFINNYKIKPEQGKLLIFPALWTYPHRGNVPLSNDKYIMTGWIYTS